MSVRRRSLVIPALVMFAASCSDGAAPPSAPADLSPSLGVQADQGPEVLSHAIIHETVQAAAHRRNARPGGGGGSPNLTYGGGVGGIGVETAPKVYLVFWGSQWTNNDPSGEAALFNEFLGKVGGSSWLNSVTQYCQGVPKGTVTCTTGTKAGNPTGILAGIWFDNGSLAPSRPRQNQIAAEAVAAASHFGNTSAAKNASVQYVIATATGNSANGFKTQYCAYHSYTSSTAGNIAYTNLPYITDAGASCGANFAGLGPFAGITMVEGHELAETMTDQFPSGGWLDSSGYENADKCAWISSGQGASTNITLGGVQYAVQSLWSNAFNSGKGGCVNSY